MGSLFIFFSPGRLHAIAAYKVCAYQQSAQSTGNPHAATAHTAAFSVTFCQFADNYITVSCFTPDNLVNLIHD